VHFQQHLWLPLPVIVRLVLFAIYEIVQLARLSELTPKVRVKAMSFVSAVTRHKKKVILHIFVYI